MLQWCSCIQVSLQGRRNSRATSGKPKETRHNTLTVRKMRTFLGPLTGELCCSSDEPVPLHVRPFARATHMGTLENSNMFETLHGQVGSAFGSLYHSQARLYRAKGNELIRCERHVPGCRCVRKCYTNPCDACAQAPPPEVQRLLKQWQQASLQQALRPWPRRQFHTPQQRLSPLQADCTADSRQGSFQHAAW